MGNPETGDREDLNMTIKTNMPYTNVAGLGDTGCRKLKFYFEISS